jgi:hypothetical protein
MIDGEIGRAAAVGRPKKGEAGKGCNATIKRGTAEYAIRRLKRDRPDLVLMGWTPPDGIDVPKWRC